ncbi:hypothetical protein PR048_020926 [Dryococelus australis]|uniref:Polyprotein n=1 Tax=Dryococelus australis TaxID=614101 RepID=A0ABQ9GWS0_9NEOP|nr:hypothetical protein PR048_020926 [Dryococelus australis]
MKGNRKKEDIIRNAKVKVIERTNHNIPEAEWRQIMENFNYMASKNEQDSRLSGLIALHMIAQRRPRVSNHGNSKDHAESYTYKVRLAGKDAPVCHKTFISILVINKLRVNRLQQSLLMTGQSPKDQRGRHVNRQIKIPNAVLHLIECHINSSQARKSHYSLRDNPHRRYLPEHLTVAKMHELFVQEYHINVPYNAYWLVFKTLSMNFGFPRSDICNLCDPMEQKMKTADTQEGSCILEIEKALHLKIADAYRAAKKKHTLRENQGSIHAELAPSSDNNWQLWYNIFGVHNLGEDSATMYRFCEREGKKGRNEVTSMLLDYINHYREDEIK